MSAITKDSHYTLNNGQTIPITAFGVYQTPPDVTTNLVYEALKAGYRHIDSAIYYNNELESVKGIKKFLDENPQVKRSEVFYTTKINILAPTPKDELAALIKKSYEIAKPYIEYIDLFLIHSPYPDEETRFIIYDLLQDAAEAGWTKSIGISNYGVKHIDALYAWKGLRVKPVVNQVELHPWLPRKDIQEAAKKYGFLLEAYTPLTQGKKLDDAELVSIAKKHGKTPAEILLAWSYAQGFIPIAKTATVGRIQSNYDVLDHVKLDDEDLKILEKPESYEVLAWDPTIIA